jgi:curved DNA-binding protein CbpA
MPQPANYFSILGVPLDASFDAIEQGYRRVKRLYDGDAKQLKLIEEAYRTLINPFKKSEYLVQLRKSQGIVSPVQPTQEEPPVPGKRQRTSVLGMEGPGEPPARPGPKPASGSGRNKTQIFSSDSGGENKPPELRPQTDSSNPSRTSEPTPQPPSGKQRSKTQIITGGRPTESIPGTPSNPVAPAESQPEGKKPSGRNKTQVVGTKADSAAHTPEPQTPTPSPETPSPAPSPKQQSGGRTKTVVMGAGTPVLPGKPTEKKSDSGGTDLVGPTGKPEGLSSPAKGSTQIYPSGTQSVPLPAEAKKAEEPVNQEPPHELVGEGTVVLPDQHKKPAIRQWEVVVTYQGQSTVIRISPGENLIGRPRADGTRPPVALDDPEKFISRTHATIVVEPEKVTIQDNGSPNGTLLNGQKMVPNQPMLFREGEVVVIEGREIRIRPAKVA